MMYKLIQFGIVVYISIIGIKLNIHFLSRNYESGTFVHIIKI